MICAVGLHSLSLADTPAPKFTDDDNNDDDDDNYDNYDDDDNDDDNDYFETRSSQ